MSKLTRRDLLRDWGTNLSDGEVEQSRGLINGDNLFGWRTEAFRLFLANVLELDRPDLAKAANHGYWWHPGARGLNSRHIAILPAALPGYHWLGVESRHHAWAHLATPIATADVEPLLTKWGLWEGTRWHWAGHARLLTCPWTVPGKVLGAKDVWWYAAAGANGILITVGTKPWSQAPVRGATDGCVVNKAGKAVCSPIVAIAKRAPENIEKTHAKLGHAKAGWYPNEPAVLKEVLRVGSAWAHRAAVLGDLNPLEALDE